MFTCQCCLCNYEKCEVKYVLKDNEDEKESIYCRDCIKYIHSQRWKLIKESLLGLDCLATFKTIQKDGIAKCLLEKDVSKDIKSKNLVDYLIIDNKIISAVLEKDITDAQLSDLVKDLKKLDPYKITELDIHNIAQKYWAT